MEAKLKSSEKGRESHFAMGNLPQEGEIDIWKNVIAERGKPFGKDFWKVKKPADLELDDLILYRIEEITYEEDSPQLEALENALSCMTVAGMNLVYLILGEKGKVKFYFGVVRDLVFAGNQDINVKEAGDAFLRPALEGNFRGSIVRELDVDKSGNRVSKPGEKNEILETLRGYLAKPQNCRVLYGVPGSVKDKENRDFRGIDRLVDIMQDDCFGLMILAKPIDAASLSDLRHTVFLAYEMLSAASKQSVQIGMNSGESSSLSVNIGKSISKSKTVTHGVSKNESVNSSNSVSEKRSEHSRFTDGSSKGKTLGAGTTDSKSDGTTEGENIGEGKTLGANRGSSVTVSSDLTNKIAADWVKYFDDVIVPRLDYARGKGAYVVSATLFGSNPNVVRKLSQAARSIFAGEMANMVPLLSREPSKSECEQLQNMTIPYHVLSDKGKNRLPYAEAGLLEYAGPARVAVEDDSGSGKCVYRREENTLFSGNWMSVRELALMAGLPQKEVVGLRLKEEVEFGLNVPEERKDDEKVVVLGDLVKSGNTSKGCEITLAQDQLDRHVFVAGVTGSGKTTTCQTLLLSSKWPFLVIEPAKAEYRGLRFPFKDKDGNEQEALCPDLLVFTLGDDTGAPFRLNPFELIPGESITTRVDMLMASITAAFDMEAAIPQLIERAIYACYEECGWRVDDNKNVNPDPFADGVFAFPTLSDVLRMTEKVVDEQGFDDRLKRDYIGSIKARLQGLTLGAKGFMLDCPRSIDFMKLLDRQVVLELEPIPNAAQKSLIIGFVLTNLLQAVKRKFQLTKNAKVNHITLIEEAHRLLSKPEPGGNPSQKQAAETFADMLAEIRKYGESLVIADQIPSKLTPEVMKNTNTKIIHRLFAQDDKEAVGHTMGLEEDQAKFFSNLAVGRAVVFNGNWPKAIQVQITQAFRTDAKIPENGEAVIREAALKFYAQDYKRGVFGMSHLSSKEPTVSEIEENAKRMQDLMRHFREADGKTAKRCSPVSIQEFCAKFGADLVQDVLSKTGAYQEFLDIVDATRNVAPKDLKTEALWALVQKYKKNDASCVWRILAAREFAKSEADAKAAMFDDLLEKFSKLTEVEYGKNPGELRDSISNLLSKLRQR